MPACLPCFVVSVAILSTRVTTTLPDYASSAWTLRLVPRTLAAELIDD
jgi:hypothetical protein